MELSVITPVYNAASHIERFFSNHFAENLILNEVEFIFVNDGSTDNSQELLEDFVERNKDKAAFRVLFKSNGGAASARNVAVHAAQGKYLAYVDIDDTINLQGLLEQLDCARQREVDLLAFNYNYIKLDGTIVSEALRHPIPYNEQHSGLFFLEKGYQPSSVCVFLVKRSFVTAHQLYFVEGITHEDVELSFRYMLFANKVLFTEHVLYHYFQQQESVTNQISKEKRQKYLTDEVVIAVKMKSMLLYPGLEAHSKTIEANYNSVVWNLLYGMWKFPEMLDVDFLRGTLTSLSAAGLYPIKGALKTRFQNFSRYLMNIRSLYFALVKYKMK